MASKGTGFHPLDADYTQGRAEAIAEAEAIARRMDGLARKVGFVKADAFTAAQEASNG